MGMTVNFNANNGSTVPYWYDDMNSLNSNEKLYVRIAYLSNAVKRSIVAKQIKDNLSGSGNMIDFNAFLFDKITSGAWKLNKYETNNSWIKTNNETKNLTFPNPSEVEEYIKD
jgi:hypothetical protein